MPIQHIETELYTRQRGRRKVSVMDMGAKLRILSVDIDIDASFAAGSTVKVCKLPRDARIANFLTSIGNTGTGTPVSLGSTSDPEAYAKSLALNGRNTVTINTYSPKTTLLPVLDDGTVVATFKNAITAPATITFNIVYICE